MRKYVIWGGIVQVVGILILSVLAYEHSFQVYNMYDQRMHRDVQTFTQDLSQAGVSEAQIKILRSLMLDMNRNTLSYVSSEVSNIIGILTVMGIIIMSFSMGLAGKAANQKKDE